MGTSVDLLAAPLGRRGFLALAAWAAAAVALPRPAFAGRRTGEAARELSFLNLHTGESLSAVYWEQGAYLPDALAWIDTLLRDHRTDEIRPMAPLLLDLLFALRRRLGTTAPYHVISGYRSASTNEHLRSLDPAHVAEASLHLTGEAVDIRVPDRPLRKLRDAARGLQGGGVGYYPRSGFVHLDVGRIRAW